MNAWCDIGALDRELNAYLTACDLELAAYIEICDQEANR